MVVSRLVVRRIGEGKDARHLVILGRPRGVRDIPDYGPPRRLDMLPREMARQALLIAARDELGLATRDEVIDDTPADGEEDVAGVKVLESARTSSTIRRHAGRRQRPPSGDPDPGRDAGPAGALARGYALLGILREFQWHPAHRAYKARPCSTRSGS